MTPDPPVRRDGLCAQCGKPRKHAHWNKYGEDQALHDPFCSTECCRAYHGCELPVVKQQRVDKPSIWQTDNARERRRRKREAAEAA